MAEFHKEMSGSYLTPTLKENATFIIYHLNHAFMLQISVGIVFICQSNDVTMQNIIKLDFILFNIDTL